MYQENDHDGTGADVELSAAEQRVAAQAGMTWDVWQTSRRLREMYEGRDVVNEQMIRETIDNLTVVLERSSIRGAA